MQNILSIKFRFVDVGNALEMWVALETFINVWMLQKTLIALTRVLVLFVAYTLIECK